MKYRYTCKNKFGSHHYFSSDEKYEIGEEIAYDGQWWTITNID